MNSIDKLFLLDAYALIYRAYYAFIKNPRINSKGFNTSAILGFVNTWKKCSKRESHTHRSSLRPVGPHLPPRGLRAIQGTARGDTRGHPPFRTYYKGHHPRLPHSHPRSIRLRSRRRDRHARHRSRTAGHHHLYDDSRQGLRPTGIRPRLHVPPQAYRRIRGYGHGRGKDEVQHTIHRAGHRHAGTDG